MCLGIMPAPILGSKYGFHDFVAMGQAVKCGDVKSFERIMQQREKSLIRVGIFLVLEQVCSLCILLLCCSLCILGESACIPKFAQENISRNSKYSNQTCLGRERSPLAGRRL